MLRMSLFATLGNKFHLLFDFGLDLNIWYWYLDQDKFSPSFYKVKTRTFVDIISQEPI